MIAILMATYNGSAYLAAQLDSIFAQTRQDFCLYAADDVSSDATLEILRRYEEKYPRQMRVVQNGVNSGGAKENFLSLMLSHREESYFMLSDQDDVWLPDKIELSMRAMEAAQAQYGAAAPLLVHTDLRVVEVDLSYKRESLNRDFALDMHRHSLNEQIVQNTLTGCTALYNRALAVLLRPASYCAMHDGWLMLTAAAFGRVVYLPQPTVLYRQHGDNVLGAKRVYSPRYIFKKLQNISEMKQSMTDTYKQAESFLRAYGDMLSTEQIAFLRDYANIPNLGWWDRRRELLRLRAQKSGLLRRIAQLVFV